MSVAVTAATGVRPLRLRRGCLLLRGARLLRLALRGLVRLRLLPGRPLGLLLGLLRALRLALLCRVSGLLLGRALRLALLRPALRL